jgi:hypothetical protein
LGWFGNVNLTLHNKVAFATTYKNWKISIDDSLEDIAFSLIKDSVTLDTITIPPFTVENSVTLFLHSKKGPLFADTTLHITLLAIAHTNGKDSIVGIAGDLVYEKAPYRRPINDTTLNFIFSHPYSILSEQHVFLTKLGTVSNIRFTRYGHPFTVKVSDPDSTVKVSVSSLAKTPGTYNERITCFYDTPDYFGVPRIDSFHINIFYDTPNPPKDSIMWASTYYPFPLCEKLSIGNKGELIGNNSREKKILFSFDGGSSWDESSFPFTDTNFSMNIIL